MTVLQTVALATWLCRRIFVFPQREKNSTSRSRACKEERSPSIRSYGRSGSRSACAAPSALLPPGLRPLAGSWRPAAARRHFRLCPISPPGHQPPARLAPDAPRLLTHRWVKTRGLSAAEIPPPERSGGKVLSDPFVPSA